MRRRRRLRRDRSSSSSSSSSRGGGGDRRRGRNFGSIMAQPPDIRRSAAACISEITRYLNHSNMNDISLLLFRESRFPQSTASKFGNWMKQMKVQGRSARAREKREAILMHFSKPPPLRFPLHPRTHKHSSGNTCAVYRDSQVDFSENGKKAKFFLLTYRANCTLRQ